MFTYQRRQLIGESRCATDQRARFRFFQQDLCGTPFENVYYPPRGKQTDRYRIKYII